jgi:hypothetical protein
MIEPRLRACGWPQKATHRNPPPKRDPRCSVSTTRKLSGHNNRALRLLWRRDLRCRHSLCKHGDAGGHSVGGTLKMREPSEEVARRVSKPKSPPSCSIKSGLRYQREHACLYDVTGNSLRHSLRLAFGRALGSGSAGIGPAHRDGGSHVQGPIPNC